MQTCLWHRVSWPTRAPPSFKLLLVLLSPRGPRHHPATWPSIPYIVCLTVLPSLEYLEQRGSSVAECGCCVCVNRGDDNCFARQWWTGVRGQHKSRALQCVMAVFTICRMWIVNMSRHYVRAYEVKFYFADWIWGNFFLSFECEDFNFSRLAYTLAISIKIYFDHKLDVKYYLSASVI